jgi:dolichol kinase
MQWGFDGRPNWFAPKRLALWGTVAFFLAVRLFIWLVATYAPRHVHGLQTGIVLMSVIVAASHFFVLKTAASARYDGNT